jgi:hypothetical protein
LTKSVKWRSSSTDTEPVRKRFESYTRSGRIGDALLDLLYATPFLVGGVFVFLMTGVAIANGPNDAGALPGFGVAALLIAFGGYFAVRAIRGR